MGYQGRIIINFPFPFYQLFLSLPNIYYMTDELSYLLMLYLFPKVLALHMYDCLRQCEYYFLFLIALLLHSLVSESCDHVGNI